ncbi:uncharacterized protein K02A2.6 [Aplysia californica]|uniref:Uncharacterized protein K02A2.6 n=1 Tax=Aplysia californica TaxID=6500 RepID=A0ABM0JVH4_APLCA|nr:uncharacterized protein K02A2.6 [Aplysia californica]
MLVADALSRAPLADEDRASHRDVHTHVREVEASWPVRDTTLEKLKQATKEDVELNCAMSYTLNGWPAYKENVQLAARNLYDIRSELSVQDGLLLRGKRIVVPLEMRKEVLQKIHHGHMGIAKCRERAAQSVWYPQIGKDIKERVANCRQCLEERASHPKEPLLPTPLPNRPFEKVALDLFELKGRSFVVVIDYYSCYPDIGYLPNQKASTLVTKLKIIFARHGIPETVVSDSQTNLTSHEFQRFAQDWGFQHITSSPHFPSGNGAAECRVKLSKRLLRQEDYALALLMHRATPIPGLGASPAELAMGRKMKTTLPTLPTVLQPRTVNTHLLREKDRVYK